MNSLCTGSVHGVCVCVCVCVCVHYTIITINNYLRSVGYTSAIIRVVSLQAGVETAENRANTATTKASECTKYSRNTVRADTHRVKAIEREKKSSMIKHNTSFVVLLLTQPKIPPEEIDSYNGDQVTRDESTCDNEIVLVGTIAEWFVTADLSEKTSCIVLSSAVQQHGETTSIDSFGSKIPNLIYRYIEH